MKKINKLQQAKILFTTLTGLPAKKMYAQIVCKEGSLVGRKMLSTVDWHHAIANISKRMVLVEDCPFDDHAQSELDKHNEYLRKEEEEKRHREERRRRWEERRRREQEERAEYERRWEEVSQRGDDEWDELFRRLKEEEERQRRERQETRKRQETREAWRQQKKARDFLRDASNSYRNSSRREPEIVSTDKEVLGAAQYIVNAMRMHKINNGQEQFAPEASRVANVHVLRGDYKRLARIFHPDLNTLGLPEREAHEAMQILNNVKDSHKEFWEMLVDF